MTEAANPANERGVARVVLALDVLLLRSGLVIVDTPGGTERFVATANELLAAGRLSAAANQERAATWRAQLLHTGEELLHRVDDLPRFVAQALTPGRDHLAIADPDHRAPTDMLSARVPGLAPGALVASRRLGRWSVTGRAGERVDRVVAVITPELIGPVRAATLDRGAVDCGPRPHGVGTDPAR